MLKSPETDRHKWKTPKNFPEYELTSVRYAFYRIFLPFPHDLGDIIIILFFFVAQMLRACMYEREMRVSDT